MIHSQIGNPELVDAGAPEPIATLEPESLDGYEGEGDYLDWKGISYRSFPTAKHALAAIIKTQQPKMIGFGEFHQTDQTAHIRSALVRFTSDLLPVASNVLSDLVVETWIPEGCGEAEAEVTKQVEEVTERPAEAENETVTLLKAVTAYGAQSHIMKVGCEDYRSVFAADGNVDFYVMLQVVGKLLGQKAAQVLVYRLQEAKKASQPYDSTIAIYGGAIHNDVNPAEGWAPVSFGTVIAPAVENSTGGNYIEVDLCVPEFLESNELFKNEPWLPLLKEKSSKDEAILIKIAANSYKIVFRRDVLN
ncbi:MAG: hypothetical protein GY847_34765 [Proteobacteria bacterium]|nr:hypothetical protein [Pseudomonadota bacterium]